MGEISLTLPEVGQPDRTEDPKIVTALQALETLLNGNIEESNLAANLIDLIPVFKSVLVTLNNEAVTKAFTIMTVTHGLGFTPKAVLGAQVQPGGTLEGQFIPSLAEAFGGTTYEQQMYNGSGETFLAGSRTIQLAFFAMR